VRITCPNCGGRGETWTEPCSLCVGTGESVFHQALRVSVPPRVADGACVHLANPPQHGALSRPKLGGIAESRDDYDTERLKFVH
jgi:molecular chaperone DnaJ